MFSINSCKVELILDQLELYLFCEYQPRYQPMRIIIKERENYGCITNENFDIYVVTELDT